MRTHDDFIVPLHLKTKPPVPWPDIPLSHIILTLNQPVLALSCPNNTKHLTRKRKVWILRSLVWLNQSSNLGGLKTPNSQIGKLTLYPFALVDFHTYLLGGDCPHFCRNSLLFLPEPARYHQDLDLISTCLLLDTILNTSLYIKFISWRIVNL